MAAEFLVMLYEYSPLFYISVISVCFIITVAVVLGWFGFDVPVLLRSSDETEPFTSVPERKMVQVTNPFSLNTDSTSGTVTDGVALHPYCLEDCVLSCFWGCEVQALQAALQHHQREPRLCTAQVFQESLDFCYHQRFNVQSEERVECFTKIPPDLRVRDFGLMPRDKYPLVAVLTLACPDIRSNYNIVANVTVLHVPDDKYRLPTKTLFQYLLTAHGNLFDLKPLFMSADNSDPPNSSEPSTSTETPEPQTPGRAGDSDSEGEWPSPREKDCVVCQNGPINRVLLPCRHACVCDGCVSRFRHCPICRGFVRESFALSDEPSQETEDVLNH